MRKILILSLGLIVIAGLAWWSFGSKIKKVVSPSEDVKIESVEPAFGPVGTIVAITGEGLSTDINDIGFVFENAQVGNNTTGYLNVGKSTDGKTLQFKLPEAVGVCAASTAKANTACIELALIPPKEKIKIFVVNKKGTSNMVDFTVK